MDAYDEDSNPPDGSRDGPRAAGHQPSDARGAGAAASTGPVTAGPGRIPGPAAPAPRRGSAPELHHESGSESPGESGTGARRRSAPAPHRESGSESRRESGSESHPESGTDPRRASAPAPHRESGSESPRDSGSESHPESGTDPRRASVPGPRREPAWPGAARPAGPPPETLTGIAALSPHYRVGAALALAVVAAVACVHLGMLFLHVAPSNTVTKEHGKAVDEWIYPEFEQNWKLFAPNPLQQNIAVQARAQVRTPDGGTRTTGWYDLSAQDGRAIEGNPLPSHTQQNELRRAWDFVAASHGDDNRPAGRRGELAEQYLRRIVVLRLNRVHAAGPGGAVERVQVRSRTTDVPPPAWTDEKASGTPAYHELPWWPVSADDTEGGAR